jgi:hypothetical protein
MVFLIAVSRCGRTCLARQVCFVKWLAIETGEGANTLIAQETYAIIEPGLASGEYLVRIRW